MELAGDKHEKEKEKEKERQRQIEKENAEKAAKEVSTEFSCYLLLVSPLSVTMK